MKTPLTNEDVLRWEKPDTIFIVCQSPIQTPDGIVIRIDPRETAAVRRKRKEEYPGQYLIEDIRTGKHQKEGIYLLSGGTLITDQCNRIALGLRNGNSDDPFVFTNIGAGRCDQGLEDHCYQEMWSEFILCVRTGEKWYQVEFPRYTNRLDELYESKAMPSVRQSVKQVVGPGSGFTFGGVAPPQTKRADLPTPTSNIIIDWQNARQNEKLPGFVWVDEEHRTVEFRLSIQFDLSAYDETRIFYPEGTGYAVWKSIAQINGLVLAQRFWQQRLVTPFLEKLA